MRTFGSWWCGGLLVALSMVGCGGSETPDAATGVRPNIIFVSIDSLRADHLGCYGYSRPTSPFLDKLARKGLRFENALSTTSWTLPSHAAMFTGLLGPTHGLVDNGMSLSEDHVTMAELLGENGYDTAGFFGGPYLHPTFGMAQGFDVYESCMTTTPEDQQGEDVRNSASAHDAPSHRDITGPRTRERVQAWAEKRTAGDASSPYFLFVHLWDVHYDYYAPKEYEALFADPNYSGPVDGRLMSNEAIRPDMSRSDLAQVLALYDAEIRFTDDILEGIFADLEKGGLLENTLVVITSDHGEEFFEHGMKGHNKSLFDEVLRVPLIVSWPEEIEGGRTIRDQVQIIDLLPTFASVAGVIENLPVQGKDLAPLLEGRAMKSRDALSGLFIDGMSQRALRSNQRKVVRMDDAAPAVYIDLVANPRETFQNVITPDSPSGQDIRRRGEAEIRAAAQRAEELRRALGKRPPNQIELSDALRNELSKLGYLGNED